MQAKTFCKKCGYPIPTHEVPAHRWCPLCRAAAWEALQREARAAGLLKGRDK